MIASNYSFLNFLNMLRFLRKEGVKLRDRLVSFGRSCLGREILVLSRTGEEVIGRTASRLDTLLSRTLDIEVGTLGERGRTYSKSETLLRTT